MHAILILILATCGGFEATAPATQHEHSGMASGAYAIPGSIKAEHEELHAALAAAIKLGGKTGAAAEDVEHALAPHFAKEEEYALPPLGLLKALSAGTVGPDMHATAQMAVRLKAELPRMLEEHRSIVKTLDALAAAARAERQTSALEFTEKLKLHAQNEEEVLYPAAILVGEYVTLKMQH